MIMCCKIISFSHMFILYSDENLEEKKEEVEEEIGTVLSDCVQSVEGYTPPLDFPLAATKTDKHLMELTDDEIEVVPFPFRPDYGSQGRKTKVR